MKKRIALNFELPAAQGQAALPEWLELVPAGEFQGRDGRRWINDQPDQVLAYNQALNRDTVVDIEHASELKAPQGEPAPAGGWIRELAVRDGAVWGRVEWTDLGTGLLSSRHYRYYSPALLYDAEHRVRGIASVGLTNKHNLDLPALNHQSTSPKQEQAMTLPAAIRKALGLADDAGEAQALNAIDTLKSEKQVALNAAQQPPDLAKYVPRADYDALKTKHGELETALNSERSTQREKEITALVDQAIEDGKVTPATRDFYLATCRQENGIEQFKQFITKAPRVTAEDSDLDQRQAEQHQTALNSEQQKIAAMFGNSAEDIAKYSQ